MRPRAGLLTLAIVAVAVAGLALALRDRGGVEPIDPGPGSPASVPAADAPFAYPLRSVQAGPVLVSIRPLRFDGSGAAFEIGLETHSVDLSVDLAGAARLEVAGAVWPGATWEGDPPGGHHRSGELRFPAAGPAEGTAVLTIDGLPRPVEASWDVVPG